MPKPNLNIPKVDSSAEGFDQIFLQLCANAPKPTKDEIEFQMRCDMQANPHNEPYHNKRPRRSRCEIEADLAINYALTVLCRMRERRELDWSLT